MSEITKIEIATEKKYTVYIGDGLINDCGRIIAETVGICRIAVISDTNVAPLYASAVERALKDSGFDTVRFVIHAGEQSKNVNTLSEIWEFLAKNQLTRADAVLALGGGVVGDVAGFAAATYLRGIPCIQMPTSLLAAVDSSVGGKTAVDLCAGKNLAGAFCQPAAVICDTSTLDTLPSHNVADGAAECIKYGVLGNERILEIFNEAAKIKSFLPEIIAESVKMKAEYVCKDEFDKGERMFLNLGHTIGHSIERLSNFEISHGFAVAVGMAMITEAGERLEVTEAGTAKALKQILTRAELPTSCEFKSEDLARAAAVDKKRAGDSLTLIVPKRLGKCETVKIPADDLIKYLP